MFYIWSEDLAPGMVGPFTTREAAEAHIEFMRGRGDASVIFHNNAKVVTPEEIEIDWSLRWAIENNLCSPEKDRSLDISFHRHDGSGDQNPVCS